MRVRRHCIGGKYIQEREYIAETSPGCSDEVRSLDEIAWSVAVPMMIGAGTVAAVVTLGLFLSAAGIFSLMSVSVARRTREIGLRTALGASRGRLIAGVFSRALTTKPPRESPEQ